MSKTTIGIKITGINNIVYLADFLKAGNDLLELVSEIDSAISENHKSTVDWKLKVLSYCSPATLVIEPEVKEDRPDNRASIVETVLEGIDKLKRTNERPSGFNDKALVIARELAKVKDNNVDIVEIFSEDVSVEYTTESSKKQESLTPSRRKSLLKHEKY